MTDDVAARWEDLCVRVADACGVVGRDADEVAILLAVKTQPAALVRSAISAGARLLGHNRVQEMTTMGPQLAGAPHEMHLIGQLQRNKARQALAWATCVQSVDGERLADRLEAICAEQGRSLDVFAQVNVSAEATKSGVAPSSAVALARHLGGLEHLRLRGLMTIGANSPDPDVVRSGFEELAALRDEVVASGAPGTAQARELSMGMSGDLELAIASGSTMVRVGSALFGPR